MCVPYLRGLSVHIYGCRTITSISKRWIDISFSSQRLEKRFSLEIFHEQLPLPVPCYDLALVTEFTVGPHEAELRVLPAPLA